MMKAFGLQEYYLEEIEHIERSRAELSRAILSRRFKRERQHNICWFLLYERDKHEFSAEIAQLALYEDDRAMLDLLYCAYHCAQGEPLLPRIRQEQELSVQLAAVVHQCLKENSFIDFTRRRVLKDINRYVLAQARLYTESQE